MQTIDKRPAIIKAANCNTVHENKHSELNFPKFKNSRVYAGH